jgi:hypothetical protein
VFVIAAVVGFKVGLSAGAALYCRFRIDGKV